MLAGPRCQGCAMVIKSVVVWTVVLVGLVESDLTIPVRMRQLTPRLENTIRDVIVHEAIEKSLKGASW